MEKLNLSLQKYALFPDGLLKAINRVMKEDTFERSEIILNKGRVNDRCYFIDSGLIKIVGEENNKPVIPYILDEDDFVIATDSFLLCRPTKYQIIAIEDVKVVSATLDQMLEINKEYPIMSMNINKIQAHYRNEKEKEINLLKSLSAQEKYDWFKYTKSNIIGRLSDEEIQIYLDMSDKTYYKCKNSRYNEKKRKKQ